MSSILVFQASPEINLTPITDRLWQSNIPHRVVMNKDSQDLWVARIEDAEQVKIWVQQWQAGELSAKADKAEALPWQVKLQQQIILASRFPFTAITLLIICAIFFLQQFGFLPLEDWLLEAQYWSGEKLDYMSFWQNDLLRWWTPALIHLSFMHLLMNGFWWWILGREIEQHDGHLALIGLSIVLSVATAFAQYLAVGPYFAGLSGVVYGLMGWAWGRQYLYRKAYPDGVGRYQLPQWLFPFMMISMVVIMMVDGLGASLNIGHESHLSGAIVGVILAFLWPVNKQFIENSRSSSNSDNEGEENDS